jgi:hypothetical protein
MEITIIIVVVVIVIILASFMIVGSRRTRSAVPGSSRPSLTSIPASPSLTGSSVSTMQTSTPSIRVTRRQPGTISHAVEETVTQAASGTSATQPVTLTVESAATTASITIKARRESVGAPTPPPGLTDPIRLPETVQIFHRQTECKICKQDIRWSSRQTGWVRCLQINTLVHGHCHHFVANTGSANWCSVCMGPCLSNQPMRVEGREA